MNKLSTVDDRPFHFKPFSLYHHSSTMKVGTDAVLLGIWTDLTGIVTAVDVGAGSGVISLLLASRSPLRVDAVELDKDSFEEASKNFAGSLFSNRLKVFHVDFNAFILIAGKKYDLVISNPPFFINNLQSRSLKKRMARHAETLTYGQLLEGSRDLLNPNGKLSVVLPYDESRFFVSLALTAGFHIEKQMLIFPKYCKGPNRINLLMGLKPVTVQNWKFIIRNEDGKFTEQYLDFVKDYYLDFK